MLCQRRKLVPEVLDGLLVCRQVLCRVGQELLKEALRAVRTGEVGARVAIEVLGDLLSLADDLDGLLLEVAVGARVRVRAALPERTSPFEGRWFSGSWWR